MRQRPLQWFSGQKPRLCEVRTFFRPEGRFLRKVSESISEIKPNRYFSHILPSEIPNEVGFISTTLHCMPLQIPDIRIPQTTPQLIGLSTGNYPTSTTLSRNSFSAKLLYSQLLIRDMNTAQLTSLSSSISVDARGMITRFNSGKNSLIRIFSRRETLLNFHFEDAGKVLHRRCLWGLLCCKSKSQ